MKNYTTSKDYKHLRVLLDSGVQVIASVDGRLTYIVRSNHWGCYLNSQIEVGTDISDDSFVKICEAHEVLFIEPTK